MCQGKRKGAEVGDAGGSLVLEVWLYNELMLNTLGRLFDLYGSCAAAKRGKGSRKCCSRWIFASGQNFNAVNDHAKR
jgi:hypothetical protein